MEEEGEQTLQHRLLEVQRRITKHPGHQEYLLCLSFQQSINAVFLQNWRELQALLDRAATDSVLAHELIQNVGPPTVREAFQAATIQRLHNYVASTMTLVDHSRRVMRGRQDPLASDFKARLAELRRHPEIDFIKDLRNFLLHRELPFLGHRLSMNSVNTPQMTMDSDVRIGVHQLLESDGWCSSSKTYLASLGDAVSLRPLISKHGKLIFEFNSWLHDEVSIANVGALKEVNHLVVERNAILAGCSFEEAQIHTQRWTDLREGRIKPREVFGKDVKP